MPGIGATPAAIHAAMNPKATIDDGYLGNWDRGFDSQNAHRHLQVYANLVAAVGHLDSGWEAWPRFVEKFATVINGDGKYNYAITNVAPNEGVTYDPNLSAEAITKALFGVHPQDIRQAVINNVRQKVYGTTVNASDLRAGGFEGVRGVAEKQMASLENSDWSEEFNFIWTMVQDAIRKGIGADVSAPSPDDAASTTDFLGAIFTAVESMEFPTTQFNPARTNRTYQKDELRILIRTSALSKMRTAYSGAYNLAFARPLPDEQFVPIPDRLWASDLSDVQYVIVTKAPAAGDSTVVVVDNDLIDYVELAVPYGRANHFRTHNSVVGINPFAAFIVGRNGTVAVEESAVPVPATVNFDILLNGNPVTELRRGWDYELVAESVDADGWFTGRGDIEITSEFTSKNHTYVDLIEMRLYVGIDEQAEEITLDALAPTNNSIKKTVTKPITGQAITFTPPYKELVPGEDNGGGENPGGGGNSLNLNPTNVASFAGNTAIPGTIIGDYTLFAEGIVGGVALPDPSNFISPVELTQAGDTITIRAVAGPGVTLTGTTTRTLNFQAG